jgi:hypothetical protein
MPFDASTLAAVETALCDGFEYHRAMDSFIVRAGIPNTQLLAARARADEAARNSARKWPSAPKRYVAQELLTELCGEGPTGERLVASLITAVLKHNFNGASRSAQDAVAHLRARVDADRQERRDREAEKKEDLRRQQEEETQRRVRSFVARADTREAFKTRFFALMQEENPQNRGYLLESFLNEFLHFEELDPRGSFKIVGEQIDGSFTWKNRTFLTEAKWVKEPVAGAEFGAFIYKLGGKTEDTRGLYVSINGYSPEAIKGLKGKGALRFVCIDGAHITRALSVGMTFPNLLERIWRHADETGEAYLPVVAMVW